MKLGRRSLLLAGAAIPTAAYGQCVTDKFVVDACWGGVRLTVPGPSFDQNFLTGSLGTGAVFTRASTGMYYNSSGVLVSAAINTPRFDYDPVTLQLKGLLLEDASTNIAPNPPVGGAWAPGGATVAAASGIAPDGTNTMVKLSETGVNELHFTAYGQGFAGGGQWTGSVFARTSGTRYLQLAFDDGGANGIWATFDLVSGTVSGPIAATGTWAAVSASVQNIGNGIYRCSATFTPAGTALRVLLVTSNLPSPGRFPSYLGNTANAVLVWGAQVEALPYMSSHIPTTSVSVTRAADSLTYPGSGITGFSPTAGSWFLEFIRNGSVAATPRVIGVIMANSPGVLYSDSTAHLGQYDVATTLTTANLITVGDIHKGISTWIAGEAKVCLDNGTIAKSAALTTGYSGIAGNSIGVLRGTPPSENLSGWARRISYWPRVLSDSEMQAVTT